jgi:hypothetical protein
MILLDKLIMNLTRAASLGFCHNLTTCHNSQLSLVPGTMIMLHISTLCPSIKILLRYFDGKTKWEGIKGHICSHLLVYQGLIFKILSEARSLRNAKLQRICASVNGVITCDNWDKVMRLFQNSVYCLQPMGDSYTRRLIFDSILAGCILVLLPTGHKLCTI